jgi:aldehyde dehydrogenase (NAD+)
MSTESASVEERKSVIEQRHREAASEAIPEGPAKLYVGGEWVESASGETFGTRDPTTNEVLAEVAAGTAEDVDRAVAAAQSAYEDGWADTSARERQGILNEIASRIEGRIGEFATIDTLDNGKPIRESRADAYIAADYFRYFAGAARRMEGETVPTEPGKHVETIREPYGVVGQVIPWNFPLLMAAWKIAPALAAGNTVVLKPAEETPLSALELVREIGDVLPDGVLNLVTGFGEEAGAPLTSHPDVRKVAFTGSTAVGKEVMKAAAETITDVTLELGGKSPVVVFPDADVERAVRVVMLAMFYNTGECCTAGTRLFLHADVKEAFMEAFVAAAEDLTVGDPLEKETRLGPKVSREQAERTLGFVEEARELDATIHTGGGAPDDEALAEGAFVAPTIIEGLDHDSRPVQEEIFGPVEEVFEWTDYEAMIELANDVDYGLAAGVITEDLDRAYEAAHDIEAGTVWVNQYNDFPPGMPFGGFKQSGIGRENAAETLEHYTQTKSIDIDL